MNTVRYKGFGVHIKVADIERSRAFYEAVLGLRPVFGHGDDEFRRTLPPEIPSEMDDGLPGVGEAYRGVVYELTPQSPLDIAEGHVAVPDRSVFETPVGGPKVSAMLPVDSLVPLVRDKGVRPKFPVRQYYWGKIEMVLKDPDGFVVVLIVDDSEAELDALREHLEVEVVPRSGSAHPLHRTPHPEAATAGARA